MNLQDHIKKMQSEIHKKNKKKLETIMINEIIAVRKPKENN